MPTFNQLAADTFEGAALDANWQQVISNFQVLVASGLGAHGQYTEQTSPPGARAWARYVGSAVAGMGDDQYVTIKAASWAGGNNNGLGALLQVPSAATVRTGYELHHKAGTGEISIYKWLSNVRTLVAGPVAVSPAANDELTFAKVGAQLSIYRNGVLVSGLTYTDAEPLTGGRIGVAAASGVPHIIDWYGGAAVADAVGDTTPPNLVSPTGAGGTLACSGSVSTDTAEGTLYTVFTGSATAPTALQAEAGQDHAGSSALRAVSQAVSAIGAQTIAGGSITAGTRYAHYMHKDAAGNRSAVSSSASFVVSASSDTTRPTMSGDVTVTPSTSSAAAVCPTAGDNTAVVAYDASIDGGITWPYTSATPTISMAGLAPGASYTAQFRARDAAGNVSTPVLSASFTLLTAPAPAPQSAGVPIVLVVGLDGKVGFLKP